MPGLVPGMHGDRLGAWFAGVRGRRGVDVRDKPGQDEPKRGVEPDRE